MARGLSARPRLESPHGERIAAVAMGEETRNTPDGRHADASQPMDLTIGKAALQTVNSRPAIGHRLNFRRRAQVAKECSALIRRSQHRNSRKQRSFSERFLAWTHGSMDFHGNLSVLMH
jgi:hypothetical protein